MLTGLSGSSVSAIILKRGLSTIQTLPTGKTSTAAIRTPAIILRLLRAACCRARPRRAIPAMIISGRRRAIPASSAGSAPADSFRQDLLHRRDRSTRCSRSLGRPMTPRRNRSGKHLSDAWCGYRRQTRARLISTAERLPCRSFRRLRFRRQVSPRHSTNASGLSRVRLRLRPDR